LAPPSIVTACVMVGSCVVLMLIVGVPAPRANVIESPTPALAAAQP
jgi:hypothetical protein